MVSAMLITAPDWHRSIGSSLPFVCVLMAAMQCVMVLTKVGGLYLRRAFATASTFNGVGRD